MQNPSRLKNAFDKSNVDKIISKMIHSPDSSTRKKAVRELSKISLPGIKVIIALATVARDDSDPSIRPLAEDTLRKAGVNPDHTKLSLPVRGK